MSKIIKSSTITFKDIEIDYNEESEMQELVHAFKLVRFGKNIRKNSKIEKDFNISDKPTHKKSKNVRKWEEM